MDLREKLLARKAALKDDMNAIAGAMQQIDWTLALLAGDEKEEPCNGSE